ncbi:MAG: hypothetical protein ACRENZ_02375 [Thermodesulfobacteriota bacterium]
MAAPTIVNEGTHAITGETEVDVYTTTTPGYYWVKIDENDIDSASALTLRIYMIVISGGVYRKFLEEPITGSRVGWGGLSNPMGSSYGWKFSIQRTAGTVDSIPYIVEKS